MSDEILHPEIAPAEISSKVIEAQTRGLIKRIRTLRNIIDKRGVGPNEVATPTRLFRIEEDYDRGQVRLELRHWMMHDSLLLYKKNNVEDPGIASIDYTGRTVRRVVDPYHYIPTFYVRDPRPDIISVGGGVFVIPEAELEFTSNGRIPAKKIEQHAGYMIMCRRMGTFVEGLRVVYEGDGWDYSPEKALSIEYIPGEDEDTYQPLWRGIYTQQDRLAIGRWFVEAARGYLETEYPPKFAPGH